MTQKNLLAAIHNKHKPHLIWQIFVQHMYRLSLYQKNTLYFLTRNLTPYALAKSFIIMKDREKLFISFNFQFSLPLFLPLSLHPNN
ncbi:hypothetical protein L682_18950 [Aquipseudomonas alcaligenes OT 69]|nr:hypothetical protein L682_18950 [Pseudomonas alcaligenes OT 69]